MKQIPLDVVQIIISYLNPLFIIDFFEEYNIPYDFKFKYDMSNYCIYVCDNYKNIKNTLLCLENYINYYEYKNILKKFKNMIITGIKLKFNVQTILNLKLFTNIVFTNLHDIKCIKLVGISNFTYDMSIMNISIFENLNNLEILSIKYFFLQSKSNICKINCSNMHTLKILYCEKLSSFKFVLVGNLMKLQTIQIDKEDFDNFSFEACTNLLNLNYDIDMGIDNLIKFNKLEYLTLSNITNTDLSYINKMNNIKSLTFDKGVFKLNMNYLKDIYTNLKEISINDKKYDSTNLNFLENCINLESFYLTKNNQILDIYFLRNCHNLKKLEINNCFNLYHVNIIKNLHNLEHISIVDCPDLSKLDLQNNKKLKCIKFKFYENTEIYNLENCEHLEILEISYCNMQNIDFLKLTKLKILIIDNCNFIRFLNICSLTQCNKLIISYCNNLENIYFNKILYNLEAFVVSNCYKLKKINFLHNCTNLCKLVLYYNYALTYIDDLKYCKKLNYICVYGPYIKNIKMFLENKNIIMDTYELYHPKYSNKYLYNSVCSNINSYLTRGKEHIHHGFLKNFLFDLYSDVQNELQNYF
jgi:hypothetical protein